MGVFRGGHRGHTQSKKCLLLFKQPKFVFAKTTYRDGDLGGEGDRPHPLKKLGGGDRGAFIFNI